MKMDELKSASVIDDTKWSDLNYLKSLSPIEIHFNWVKVQDRLRELAERSDMT